MENKTNYRPQQFNNEPYAIEYQINFQDRHIGSSDSTQSEMLKLLGVNSLNELIERAMPPVIISKKPFVLPKPLTETAALNKLKEISQQNQIYKSFIGQGFYESILPTVIQRNVLENPGWYTQYTPYQAEISQGRLEALMIFQTMIASLSAMDIANASLLDEATAAAEAMRMCKNLSADPNKNIFIVLDDCHPQTIEVLKTRSKPLGIRLSIQESYNLTINDSAFGILLQNPNTYGEIKDYSEIIALAKNKGLKVVIAADLLSLTLFKPPGELGADVAIGSSQRFGLPLSYGGPHAAYFATKDEYKRYMPGRIVGISKDRIGNTAFRLALQTREQHIRREKATSNICTAQALPAIIAAFYAVYHGPQNLKRIASRIHVLAQTLKLGLQHLGFLVTPENFFDTITVQINESCLQEILTLCEKYKFNFRIISSNKIGISVDEATTSEHIEKIWRIFNHDQPVSILNFAELLTRAKPSQPNIARQSAYLTHEVFNKYHSETEMLRFIKRLEARDLSLTTSMIPLGSCTMKLNPTSAMLPLTWPEFSNIHPFAPTSQAIGYKMIFHDLESWLCEITGMAAVSFQPNSGAAGEYAGLRVITSYLESINQAHRNVCIIPQSAHGTNPASAALAGLKIVTVRCDPNGNIDFQDLQQKVNENCMNLAVLMVTYPSTHGVFEEQIVDICNLIHKAGGQVYMDGANLNALTCISRPAELGADVCHINLHKTFAMPHGGGGPGAGPIAVAPHLKQFLPGHPAISKNYSLGPVSSAPWGNANLLVISWMYIAMMGADGLRKATASAILNANYIANRLSQFYPLVFKGRNNFVAHECIVDIKPLKELGIEVDDIAKRLMDYGFHAPTVSWPIANTLMIEPTESESKEQIDKFCDALINIYYEAINIKTGKFHPQDNPLKNSPHTALEACSETWKHPYSRELAVFPSSWTRSHKFWPPVSRIDNVYGDRNPVCVLK